MKKKLVLGSALVLLAAIIGCGTWAYFTTAVHVTNVITTGTIKITLNEKTAAGRDVEDELLLTEIMPGVPVDKSVSVTNDDSDTAGDAWIRVKVETTVTAPDGTELPSVFEHQGEQLPAVEIAYDAANDGSSWIAELDNQGAATGIYYYSLPLAKGAETDNLFESVQLNKYLPNEYQGCGVELNVNAQAVQVKNNDAVEELTAETLDQVKGWPEWKD